MNPQGSNPDPQQVTVVDGGMEVIMHIDELYAGSQQPVAVQKYVQVSLSRDQDRRESQFSLGELTFKRGL